MDVIYIYGITGLVVTVVYAIVCRNPDAVEAVFHPVWFCVCVVFWPIFIPAFEFVRRVDDKTMKAEQEIRSSETVADEPIDYLSKTGVARTKLKPVGRAVVDGKSIDVRTKGELIEEGEKLKVVGKEMGEWIVQKAEAEE